MDLADKTLFEFAAIRVIRGQLVRGLVFVYFVCFVVTTFRASRWLPVTLIGK